MITLATHFDTEDKCFDYLEHVRWPEGVRCTRKKDDGSVCQSGNVTKFCAKEGIRRNGRKIPARWLYQCRDCSHQFTAKTGTLFDDSHLPLTKWFQAIALMVDAKKSLSSVQMQRDLGVTYHTAWFLNHRIREAMRAQDNPLPARSNYGFRAKI